LLHFISRRCRRPAVEKILKEKIDPPNPRKSKLPAHIAEGVRASPWNGCRPGRPAPQEARCASSNVPRKVRVRPAIL